MKIAMYLLLIVGFIQLLSIESAPAQRTNFSFDQCPKFASHFSLLYTTMTGQIDNISSLLLGPETLVPLGLPCLYKKFGLFNDDKSINYNLYKKLMLETVGIMGQSQENLEEYLSLIQHCYSKKGADEFETFTLVAECVNKVEFSPNE